MQEKSGAKSSSVFKLLLTEMVGTDGDFTKVNQLYKKKIKCFVKQTMPKFLISDGLFFLSAYFTKEAYDRYKEENKEKENGGILITDLTD